MKPDNITRLLVTIACSFVAGIAVFSFGQHYPKPVTVWLPAAQQGTMPLCISNRTTQAIMIAKQLRLEAGKMVNAGVVTDFQWGFDTPKPSTDRSDVDCIVVE